MDGSLLIQYPHPLNGVDLCAFVKKDARGLVTLPKFTNVSFGHRIFNLAWHEPEVHHRFYMLN
jgi:hypothetical protein